MKKEKLYLRAELWHGNKIKDPYKLIQVFFETESITKIKTNFNQILKHAFDDKYEIYTNPFESLKFFTMTNSLIRASFKILRNIDQYKRKSESNDVLHSKYLVYASVLTYEQYLNPYLIIKHVFNEQSFSQIELDLEDIMEHTLGSYGSCPSEDICISFININRLLDACRLIYKREIYDEDV